jgi:hypothetical protein
MAKVPGYDIIKLDPSGEALDYPHHERANKCYNVWMSGYTEEEIGIFYDLPPLEVQKDIMHVQSGQPVRTIIQHNNDRNRILVQRQQSEDFRKLLQETLKIDARSFLVAGISPAGILKEFREATGMIAKAEPMIAIQQNFGNPSAGSGSGIRSAEDLIRLVLRNMEDDSQLIEAETLEPEEQIRDEEDTIQDDDA